MVRLVVQSIGKKIISRIYGHGRGWVFSRTDFSDIGSNDAVAKALSRLAASGTIRRLAHGIYDYPIYSSFLDEHVAPDMRSVANAIARKFRWQIIPDGSTSVHLLGLDTQVPAQYRFLSSGPNRRYVIAGMSLVFHHQKTSHTTLDDDYAAVLVQAIAFLGKDRTTPAHRKHLAALRTVQYYRKAVRDTRAVTAWIHDEIKQIAEIAVRDGATR